MARKSKKDKIIEEIKDVFTEAPVETETPEATEATEAPVETEDVSTKAPATIMAAKEKEFARLFAIYRRNVVNPETYPFFDNIIGATYTNDRYDPYENASAYEIAKTNANRIEIDLGVIETTTPGAVLTPAGPHGPWKLELGNDGSASIYSPDANTLGAGMFTLDILLKSENKNITVQNFCGCDNVTFAGGIGNNFGNPIYDNLDGSRIIRIPFYFNGTDCTTGPGSVMTDKFKIKFNNGNLGDVVDILKVKIYRYDMI